MRAVGQNRIITGTAIAMPRPAEPALTDLLHRSAGGDCCARDELWGHLHEQLLGMARQRLLSEASADCDPTELVHEAFLKLDNLQATPRDRLHFLGLVDVGAQVEEPSFEVELQGNVTRPEADFDPDAVDFGEVPFGQPAVDRIVTLGNTGDFDLEVDALTLTGVAADDFELVAGQDGCSGVAVAPGDACGFTVRFAPTSGGSRQATLRLDSNEPEGPRFVELRGTRDVLFSNGFE